MSPGTPLGAVLRLSSNSAVESLLKGTRAVGSIVSALDYSAISSKFPTDALKRMARAGKDYVGKTSTYIGEKVFGARAKGVVSNFASGIQNLADRVGVPEEKSASVLKFLEEPFDRYRSFLNRASTPGSSSAQNYFGNLVRRTAGQVGRGFAHLNAAGLLFDHYLDKGLDRLDLSNRIESVVGAVMNPFGEAGTPRQSGAAIEEVAAQASSVESGVTEAAGTGKRVKQAARLLGSSAAIALSAAGLYALGDSFDSGNQKGGVSAVGIGASVVGAGLLTATIFSKNLQTRAALRGAGRYGLYAGVGALAGGFIDGDGNFGGTTVGALAGAGLGYMTRTNQTPTNYTQNLINFASQRGYGRQAVKAARFIQSRGGLLNTALRGISYLSSGVDIGASLYGAITLEAGTSKRRQERAKLITQNLYAGVGALAGLRLFKGDLRSAAASLVLSSVFGLVGQVSGERNRKSDGTTIAAEGLSVGAAALYTTEYLRSTGVEHRAEQLVSKGLTRLGLQRPVMYSPDLPIASPQARTPDTFFSKVGRVQKVLGKVGFAFGMGLQTLSFTGASFSLANSEAAAGSNIRREQLSQQTQSMYSAIGNVVGMLALSNIASKGVAGAVASMVVPFIAGSFAAQYGEYTGAQQADQGYSNLDSLVSTTSSFARQGVMASQFNDRGMTYYRYLRKEYLSTSKFSQEFKRVYQLRQTQIQQLSARLGSLSASAVAGVRAAGGLLAEYSGAAFNKASAIGTSLARSTVSGLRATLSFGAASVRAIVSLGKPTLGLLKGALSIAQSGLGFVSGLPKYLRGGGRVARYIGRVTKSALTAIQNLNLGFQLPRLPNLQGLVGLAGRASSFVLSSSLSATRSVLDAVGAGVSLGADLTFRSVSAIAGVTSRVTGRIISTLATLSIPLSRRIFEPLRAGVLFLAQIAGQINLKISLPNIPFGLATGAFQLAGKGLTLAGQAGQAAAGYAYGKGKAYALSAASSIAETTKGLLESSKQRVGQLAVGLGQTLKGAATSVRSGIAYGLQELRVASSLYTPTKTDLARFAQTARTKVGSAIQSGYSLLGEVLKHPSIQPLITKGAEFLRTAGQAIFNHFTSPIYAQAGAVIQEIKEEGVKYAARVPPVLQKAAQSASRAAQKLRTIRVQMPDLSQVSAYATKALSSAKARVLTLGASASRLTQAGYRLGQSSYTLVSRFSRPLKIGGGLLVSGALGAATVYAGVQEIRKGNVVGGSVGIAVGGVATTALTLSLFKKTRPVAGKLLRAVDYIQGGYEALSGLGAVGQLDSRSSFNQTQNAYGRVGQGAGRIAGATVGVAAGASLMQAGGAIVAGGLATMATGVGVLPGAAAVVAGAGAFVAGGLMWAFGGDVGAFVGEQVGRATAAVQWGLKNPKQAKNKVGNFLDDIGRFLTFRKRAIRSGVVYTSSLVFGEAAQAGEIPSGLRESQSADRSPSYLKRQLGSGDQQYVSSYVTGQKSTSTGAYARSELISGSRRVTSVVEGSNSERERARRTGLLQNRILRFIKKIVKKVGQGLGLLGPDGQPTGRTKTPQEIIEEVMGNGGEGEGSRTPSVLTLEYGKGSVTKGGKGGPATGDQYAIATIAILEAPSRQGRLDATQVIANRVANNYDGIGRNARSQVWASGQFAPTWDRGAPIGKYEIKDKTTAVNVLVKKGFTRAQAEKALTQYFQDVANPAMRLESERKVRNFANFKGVSMYGNMRGGEFLRQRGENFYHPERGQEGYKASTIASLFGGVSSGGMSSFKTEGKASLSYNLGGFIQALNLDYEQTQKGKLYDPTKTIDESSFISNLKRVRGRGFSKEQESGVKQSLGQHNRIVSKGFVINYPEIQMTTDSGAGQDQGGAGGADFGSSGSTQVKAVRLLSTSGRGDIQMSGSSTYSGTERHHGGAKDYETAFGNARDYVTTPSVSNPALDRGAPLRTPDAAKVLFAGQRGGYGNVVELQTKEGKRLARYAHFDSLKVKTGDIVQPGQVLGLQGNSGTRDVHLHLEAGPEFQTRFIRSTVTGRFGSGKPAATPKKKDNRRASASTGSAIALLSTPATKSKAKAPVMSVTASNIAVENDPEVKQLAEATQQLQQISKQVASLPAPSYRTARIQLTGATRYASTTGKADTSISQTNRSNLKKEATVVVADGRVQITTENVDSDGDYNRKANTGWSNVSAPAMSQGWSSVNTKMA